MKNQSQLQPIFMTRLYVMFYRFFARVFQCILGSRRQSSVSTGAPVKLIPSPPSLSFGSSSHHVMNAVSGKKQQTNHVFHNSNVIMVPVLTPLAKKLSSFKEGR